MAEVDKGHPEAGFIELEPLAIGVVDLIWVVIALFCLLVVCAGWVLLYILHLALGKVSIFGFHPFNFFYTLATDALQSVAGYLIKKMDSFAHFVWSLVMTIWRPLYVIVTLMQYLLNQITGVNQEMQRNNANLRAQEQADVAQLRGQEQSDIFTLDTIIAAESTNLQNQINNLTNSLNADVRNLTNGAQADANRAQANAETYALGQANAVRSQLTTFETAINNRVTSVNTSLSGEITKVENTLEGQVKNGISTAENFATGLVSGLGIGSITSAVTALQGQMKAVETDITECLDPLCSTVTPNAQRAGRNLNFLKNLEAIGFEAALFALAAECLVNPGAVVSDVSTVVNDVGKPIMDAGEALIGL